MKALELDRPYIEALSGLIREVASTFGLAPEIAAAVMSRESGGGRLLGKNGCPPGTGDRGHGRGLMQIDDRWHQGFLSVADLWRNPAANLAYGCHLLRRNLDALDKRMPGLDPDLKLKAALAAYNCGLSRALSALASGADPDQYTTGKDYGADVMRRATWLGERVFARAGEERRT